MKRCILSAAAAVVLAAPLTAQTLTVNKSAVEDGVSVFNTLSGALAAVAVSPGPDPADPRVIQITDSELYEEVVNIEAPVVIEATGEDKATLALLSNPNGTPMPGETIGNGGIWINLPSTYSTGTVVLRNLNILPALNDTDLTSRLRSAIENGNNNLYLEVDNCIITANENNAPLVTDPVSSRIYAVFPGSTGTPEPYNPDIVMFGGHGIVLGRTYTGHMEGDGVELLLKDSVISHLKNDYHPVATEPERYPTGIVMHSPYGNDPGTWDPSLTRITRVEGESGVSYCRVLISAAGDLNVEGTEDTPVVLRGSNAYSIRFDGPAFNYRDLTNVTIVDMSQSGILDRGFGPIRWTMNNCRMFMALHTLIRVEPGKDGDTVIHPASGLISINDSTLIGGRYHASSGHGSHVIRLEVDTQADIHFENSIIGGKKDLPAVGGNVVSIAGYNVATANGTSFIVDGPYALRPSNPFSRGTNATVPPQGDALWGLDPEFLVTDVNGGPNWPVAPGFLDVQSTDYATRSSTGGPLGGGAEYVGASNVTDWAVY